MSRLLLPILACVLAGVGLASDVSAASIHLSSAVEYATCPSVPQFVPTRLYVVAAVNEEGCGGITGAEFRVQGFPTTAEGWFSAPAWPPGVQPFGDPFGEGVRLGFPCVTAESGVVVLLAIDVFATTWIADRSVTTVAHLTPSDPKFACPTFTLCDQAGTQICVSGSETRLNDSTGSWCYCNDGCVFDECPTLGVERGTWSRVKELYR